jgi:hypothetical protein
MQMVIYIKVSGLTEKLMEWVCFLINKAHLFTKVNGKMINSMVMVLKVGIKDLLSILVTLLKEKKQAKEDLNMTEAFLKEILSMENFAEKENTIL